MLNKFLLFTKKLKIISNFVLISIFKILSLNFSLNKELKYGIFSIILKRPCN